MRSTALPLLILASLASLAYSQSVDPTCPAGYARTIRWGACGGNNGHLQCATMDVPINYVDNSGSLTIPIARYPAKKTPVLGSIFYNPGGPGGSALNDLASPQAADALQSEVGPQWNIIAFDPRGVNINNPYKCDGSDEIQDLSSSQGFATTAQSYNSNAQTCAAGYTGIFNKYISTAAVATDIVAMYEALSRNAGDDGLINYWGFSYGTLLGSTLAQMYPSKIHRMVLDGNVDPTGYYDGTGSGALTDTDNTVKNYFSLCVAAGSLCPLYKGTNTTQQSLLNQLDAYLAKRGQADVSKMYLLESCLFGAMYFPHITYVKFASWLDNILNFGADFNACPNYRGNNGKRDVEPGFDASQTLQRGSDGVLEAITGVDRRTRLGNTGPAFQNYWMNLKNISTYGADAYAGNVFVQQSWMINAAQSPVGPFAGIAPSANILYLNGNFDPITPLASAEKSSAGFAKSGVVVSSGAGHCTSSDASTDLQIATAQYFLDGNLPTQRSGYKLDQPNPWINDGAEDQSADPVVDDDNLVTDPTPESRRRDSADDFIEILGITRSELLAHMLEVQQAHANEAGTLRPGVSFPGPGGLLHKRGIVSFGPAVNGIPAGCQPVNSTIVSTTTSASTYTPSTASVTSATSQVTTSTWTYSTISSSFTSSSSSHASTTCSGITATVTVTDCETQIDCPHGVPHCAPRTITHTRTTATVIPTITSWWADLVDVCSTGLTTHHVPITYSHTSGFFSRPTGCPDGYTTTKALCTACKPQGYIDATVPIKGWAAVESDVAVAAAHGGDEGAHGGNGSGGGDSGQKEPVADTIQVYGTPTVGSDGGSPAQPTANGDATGGDHGGKTPVDAASNAPSMAHGSSEGMVGEYKSAAGPLRGSLAMCVAAALAALAL